MSQKVEKVLWLGHFALGSSDWPQIKLQQQSMHAEKIFFFFQTSHTLTKVNGRFVYIIKSIEATAEWDLLLYRIRHSGMHAGKSVWWGKHGTVIIGYK